ncbi:serine/threonine-protein kinase [Longimicrobium terrae]|uniref:Protein kinase domain-containing protein n=1 Tax=Longimicrobium terrae TaxID=1639882 RepID=A0A841H6T0_9BACT|nr:serine/threonine-protein kinase [Longimicrobium terrae]MBB4639317.1 hypothetical protein [Longimicrobium terrae]MBB6073612.1 hypothetical protein [Longimicrobium terrae]NNC29381.1 serine/threonine protein kinase [Longimicrobium terrae]
MYGIAGLLNGRVLGGRYRIEAIVGRGGMGAVYRAADERLGRAVAVKVIGIVAHEPREHERLQARFLREARAAAGLHHPNVVSVYDFGADPELGLDYLVMELLRGEDLASRLARSGPPPMHTALSILRQAARGLAAGHRAGLVHRDVKPGNLFMEESDHADEPHVRVLDFGIAQVAGEEGTTQLTEYGRAPFSPAYASPEQMRGDDRIVPASDVFSLGAVGYYLVTGYRPFTSTDPERMCTEAMEAARLLAGRAPGLPRVAADALLTALELDPRARFADCTEFAEALSRVPGSAPTVPRPRAVESTVTVTAPSAPFAAPVVPRARAPLAAAVSVEPDEDQATQMFAPERPRPAYAPAVYAPAQPYAPAGEPPAAPRRPGVMRRFAYALWDFTLTLAVMGLFAGAWVVAGRGVMDEDMRLVVAGIGSAVLLTPMAVHRLTGRRGRLGLGIAGSILATGAAVYYIGLRTDPAVLVGAVFGAQVIASFIMARLTRLRRSVLDGPVEV